MVSFHPFGGPDTEVCWENMPARVLARRGKMGTALGEGGSDRWTESKTLLRLRREGFCVFVEQEGVWCGQRVMWEEEVVKTARAHKTQVGWLGSGIFLRTFTCAHRSQRTTLGMIPLEPTSHFVL